MDVQKTAGIYHVGSEWDVKYISTDEPAIYHRLKEVNWVRVEGYDDCLRDLKYEEGDYFIRLLDAERNTIDLRRLAPHILHEIIDQHGQFAIRVPE